MAEDKTITKLIKVTPNAANAATIEVAANADGEDRKVLLSELVAYTETKNLANYIITPINTDYDESTRTLTITATTTSTIINYLVNGVVNFVPSPTSIVLPEAVDGELSLDTVYLSIDGIEQARTENIVDNFYNKIILKVVQNIDFSIDETGILHTTGNEIAYDEKQFEQPLLIAPLGSQEVLATPIDGNVSLLSSSFFVAANTNTINRISIEQDLARWPTTDGYRINTGGVLSGIITGGTERKLIVDEGTVISNGLTAESPYQPIRTQSGEDYVASKRAMVIVVYNEVDNVWEMAGYESIVEAVLLIDVKIEIAGALVFLVDATSQIIGDLTIGATDTFTHSGTAGLVLNDVDNTVDFSSAGTFFGLSIYDELGVLRYNFVGEEAPRNKLTLAPNTAVTKIIDIESEVWCELTGWTGLQRDEKATENHFIGSTAVEYSGDIYNLPFKYAGMPIFVDDFKMTVSMTALETMVIPAIGTNDFYVDWGDGSDAERVDYINPSHEYTVAGDYQIRILGQMSAFSFNNGGNKLNLISVESLGNTGLISLYGAFEGCSNLVSFDGDGNTASVTSMHEMFGNCLSLVSLDLSSFVTTSVTSMYRMFYACLSLVSLDLSSFVTTSVTSMQEMFYACSSLVSLDLSSFVTTSVATMYRMFGNCSSLVSLDLSSFVTTSVTTMQQMFYNCSLLAITADPNLFWLNPSVTTYTDCFLNATSIVNYADIPNDWKGL